MVVDAGEKIVCPTLYLSILCYAIYTPEILLVALVRTEMNLLGLGVTPIIAVDAY